jgi:NAD(P)-dependent dehydrogenase (short-subunit alcohol dehydrogenase family)
VPLSGKNVVVVGGSRGLGRKIVEETFRERANVLALARGHRMLTAAKTIGSSPIPILNLQGIADGAPGPDAR